MPRKTAILLTASLALAACATPEPRIIQASPNAPEVHLRQGMATQVEMPDGDHVRSVVVGNPNLLTADRIDNVVNLVPKAGSSGETNLIVRSQDPEGDTKVYQYHIFIAE
jgi:hypothetical protein